jgi:hypothetical protein
MSHTITDSLRADLSVANHTTQRQEVSEKSRKKISYNKPTRCTIFANVFCNETLHVSDSSSVRHQEFVTVHTAMVYVTQVY